MVLFIILGELLIVSVAAIITIAITSYQEKQMKKYRPFVFLGKLNDSDANDDINKATKFLKLTNGIDSRKE